MALVAGTCGLLVSLRYVVNNLLTHKHKEVPMEKALIVGLAVVSDVVCAVVASILPTVLPIRTHKPLVSNP